MYTLNCKTLLKEIKEDISKWENIPRLSFGRLSIRKMALLPKIICTVTVFLIKTLAVLFAEIDKLDPKIHMKIQETLNSQTVL